MDAADGVHSTTWRLSGGSIPKIANAIVICLYALELPLDNRSYVRWQFLLECRLIGVLTGVFATFAFGEDRVFVHAGNGGLYVGPSAMHRPAYRSALRGLPTKTTNLNFQFRSALGTAPGSCFEQRLEIRTSNSLGAGAEALLSISARFY